MMSKRAASSGGFAAEIKLAPAMSNQIAGVRWLETNPGMNSTAAPM
jgi:hypothetical protein